MTRHSPNAASQDQNADQPARDPRLVRAALGLYSRRWRDRYGDEYAALLSDLFASSSWLARPGLLADIAAGAVDARLNCSGGGTVTDRIRGSLGAIACAVVVFAIAGAGFQKMTEDPAFGQAARQHAAIGTSFTILRAAAIAAGIAVLASAVPLLWSIWRQAFGGRRKDLLRLLILPPLAIAAWLLICILILSLHRHPQVHSAANLASVAVILLLGAAVAAFCAWSATAILHRADLADRLLRPQVIPMIALTACMAVVTGADLTWGLAVRSADTPLFHSSNGLIATSLPPSWATGAALLAAATLVAGWATARATSHLRAPSAT
jgi:hypothetical protein